MQFVLVLLACSLALSSAKPYGVKGGYDREAVQSHIPVNEDLRAERFETERSGGRKGSTIHARPIEELQPTQGRPYGRLGNDDIIVARPLEQTGHGYGDIIVGRPLEHSGHGHRDVIVGRPLGQTGYGQGDVIVGRPLGQTGYGQGDVIVGRPLGQSGYGQGDVIVGRPLGESSILQTEERPSRNSFSTKGHSVRY